jgi:hypothetical protein
MPVIEKGSKQYDLLTLGIRQVELSLKPASPKEILTLLAKLRLHFVSNNMNQRELALMLEDYLTDLAPYPKDILEKACIEYRQNGANTFFPKIGQLISLMHKPWHARRFKLEKLQKLLELSNQKQETKHE